jgi:uncharacterized protein YdhG (YjbR/CyaY superfamily)
MTVPSTVDEYIAAMPADRRAALELMRRTIKAAAPEAIETIAYSMPAFRSHGRQFLVSYAAYKRHYSLFPASEAVTEALGEELTPFLSGKGTIRFPADQPIPVSVVAKVTEIRFAENATRDHREG